MRYLCVHCDHRFEAEGETPKRCPSCMRAKGIEPVRDEAKASPPVHTGRTKRLVGLGLLGLAVAAAAFFAWPRDAADKAASGKGVLSLEALNAALAHEQVSAGGLERILFADDAIEKFASKAADGKDRPQDKAQALLAAIRARANAGAFVRWSLGEPRATAVMTAADTMRTLTKDGGRAALYPLEVAALMVAGLRSLELPAMLAELTELRGRKSPLDPSGYIGYFVVALFPEQVNVGAPVLYDPYAGQALPPDAQAKVLTDTAAVGAALSLRALHENTYLSDPKRALESTSHALRLAGTLPSVRTVRGVVVLTEKMIEQGLQEFQAARELRPDAPRLHNLASVMLVTGEVEKAQSVLSAALEKAPEFAGAHATLGTLHLMQGQLEQAEVELETAERIAPDLSLVQWARADLLMRQGQRDEALARARKAYEARPSFDGALRFAALLRQGGKFEEMRTMASQLVERTPSYRKDEIRTVIAAVLGPTALSIEQPTEVDPTAKDLSDLGEADLKLDLAQPPASGAGAADGLRPGAGGGRLRLGQPDRKLHLDLGTK
jgi:tetratricopeptide (TPR) repeat protein